MTVKATRLRHNPFRFTTQIENLQNAGRIRTLPPWHAAMQLHPPAAKPLRSVIPAESTLGTRVWSDIYAGVARVPLSGESVVQRTLYLMDAATGGTKLTRDAAYRRALSEFYAARADEERRDAEDRKQLQEKLAAFEQRKMQTGTADM
eukprot:jgi/Hompol1/3315/HPOL_003211-RA